MLIKKLPILLIIIIINFILWSCKKTYEVTKEDIVINELMPVNTNVVADQNGEYDDWIELYNLSSANKDISGYYLSDKKSKPRKWHIPTGTSIHGNGFLIVWADKDTTQAGLHANFKLSSQGETVLLSTPDGILIDKVDFPAQSLQFTYSRNPDGTGPFMWQNPTFDRSNDNP